MGDGLQAAIGENDAKLIFLTSFKPLKSVKRVNWRMKYFDLNFVDRCQ
jgi:hypothetical protein